MHRKQLAYAGLEIGTTVLIVAAAWWYLSGDHSFALVSVPDMLDAFQRAWLFDRLTSDILPSLRRLALGYLLAVALGVSVGFALGMSTLLRIATSPVLSFARSIPAVALIPVFMALLGLGDLMKIVIIASVCCWPVLLNTTDGVVELDETMMDTTRTYGLTRWERFWHVMLPAVSPRIAAGMRTSLSLAVLLLVVSEMVASSNGIGFFVFQAQQSFSVADMWAGILLLGLLGYVLNVLFGLVERRSLHWYMATRGSG